MPEKKIILCTGIDGETKGQRIGEIATEFNNTSSDAKIFYYNVGDFVLEELKRMGESPTRANAVILQDRRPSDIEKARKQACKSILTKFQADSEGIQQSVAIIMSRAQYWHSGLSKMFYLMDDGSHDIFNPEFCINIVNDFQIMYENMKKDGDNRWEYLTKEELLNWRNEEFGTTELYWTRYGEKKGLTRPIKTYWLAVREPSSTLTDLIFKNEKKKVYLSFPISHSLGGSDKLRLDFLNKLREHFVVFDPFSIKEYDTIKSSSEDPALIKRVGHATVYRDLDLIEQSDYVVVYYPSDRIYVEHPAGEEVRLNGNDIKLRGDEGVSLSAGVITEMVHAIDELKEVYALWFSNKRPSPFFSFPCDATSGRLFMGADADSQFWAALQEIKAKKLR